MSIEAAVEEFMKDYEKDRVQMFDTTSMALDDFVTIYKGADGVVRYCDDYDYMEVLWAEPKLYNKIFKQYGY